MEDLSFAELQCLRKLAHSDEHSYKSCDATTLAELERRGLIERVPKQWLPLEFQTFTFRITTAGQVELHRHR